MSGTAYACRHLVPEEHQPGVYTITFTGVSDSLTRTAKAKFTVK